MRTMFGVCANEWATDDGAVVSLDHTCGSHSETDVPKNGTAWPVRPSRVNEGALDAEPMPRASEQAGDEAGRPGTEPAVTEPPAPPVQGEPESTPVPAPPTPHEEDDQ